MNDVKISSVDFAARQGSAASSTPPNSVPQQPTSSAEAAGSGAAQSASVARSGANGVSASASASPAVDDAQNTNQAQQASDQAEATQELVEDAVTKLNDYVQSIQRDLQFKLDDDSGLTVVTVIDRTTSEVVRQIPDDVALKLAQDLQQEEPLTLLTTRV